MKILNKISEFLKKVFKEEPISDEQVLNTPEWMIPPWETRRLIRLKNKQNHKL
jgi:hypothetical protein